MTAPEPPVWRPDPNLVGNAEGDKRALRRDRAAAEREAALPDLPELGHNPRLPHEPGSYVQWATKLDRADWPAPIVLRDGEVEARHLAAVDPDRVLLRRTVTVSDWEAAQ